MAKINIKQINNSAASSGDAIIYNGSINVWSQVIQNAYSSIIGGDGGTATAIGADTITVNGQGLNITATNAGAGADAVNIDIDISDLPAGSVLSLTDEFAVDQGADPNVKFTIQDLATLIGANDDLAGVVASRSTSQAINNGSFGTMNFNTTDYEKDAAVISHDPVTNNSRLTIGETGTYQVFFALTLDPDTATHTFNARVIKNGVLTALPGSSRSMSEDDEGNDCSNVFLVDLDAGDYIEVQTMSNQANGNMLATSNFGAVRMRGSKGEKGDPGSGSTITVEEEGGSIGVSFDTLNFIGNNITAVANGTTADITVDSKSHLYRHNGGITQVFGGSPIIVFFNTNVRTDSEYSYASGRVTINNTAWYEIEYNVSNGDANNRTTTVAYLTLNGTEIPGTRAFGYHRNSSNSENTLVARAKVNITSGDIIDVRTFVAVGTNAATLVNGCRINIMRIDAV